MEQRLWREFRKLKLPIRRQAPIGTYVADFACHSARLVVEIDGPVHELFAEVAVRDIERTAWLEGQGYRVIRFTNRQVEDDIDAVVGAIKQALEPFPLDGGRAGLGVNAQAVTPEAQMALAPPRDIHLASAASPSSPTLPPSRGNGA